MICRTSVTYSNAFHDKIIVACRPLCLNGFRTVFSKKIGAFQGQFQTGAWAAPSFDQPRLIFSAVFLENWVNCYLLPVQVAIVLAAPSLDAPLAIDSGHNQCDVDTINAMQQNFQYLCYCQGSNLDHKKMWGWLEPHPPPLCHFDRYSQLLPQGSTTVSVYWHVMYMTASYFLSVLCTKGGGVCSSSAHSSKASTARTKERLATW